MVNHNRFSFGRSLGDELLKKANRIKLDLYRCEGGVCGDFTLSGSICGEEDEPADMGLLRELLGEFVERKD